MSDQSMHDSCITLKHKEKQELRLLHTTNLDGRLPSRGLIEEQLEDMIGNLFHQSDSATLNWLSGVHKLSCALKNQKSAG